MVQLDYEETIGKIEYHGAATGLFELNNFRRFMDKLGAKDTTDYSKHKDPCREHWSYDLPSGIGLRLEHHTGHSSMGGTKICCYGNELMAMLTLFGDKVERDKLDRLITKEELRIAAAEKTRDQSFANITRRILSMHGINDI